MEEKTVGDYFGRALKGKYCEKKVFDSFLKDKAKSSR